MRSLFLTMGTWGLALASLAATPFAKAPQEDFLPPEKAYLYDVDVKNGCILVNWVVMPGYYLYRKRLGFESATAGVKLGEPDFPKGEIHHDEYFGDQEIYRGAATFAVPFTLSGPRPKEFTLKLKLQGCADAGLCYPPATWTTVVKLPL